MTHHLKETKASKGWAQPAEAVKKSARCRLSAPKKEGWRATGPFPLMHDGSDDFEEPPPDPYADVGSILKEPFDKVYGDAPSFRARCTSQGLTEWFRARWSPSHPDHARCRGFLADMIECGTFKSRQSSASRSSSAIAARRDMHMYERSVTVSHADPLQIAADKELARRATVKIQRYEAALERRRMKDGAAQAYGNEHRQEVTRSGTPLVAEILAGAYEARTRPRPKVCATNFERRNKTKIGWPAWLKGEEKRALKATLSPRSMAGQAELRVEQMRTTSRRRASAGRDVAYNVAPIRVPPRETHKRAATPQGTPRERKPAWKPPFESP
eukprot:Hpha_TRINITY_DN8669_c0_g1::TRINITY_DN8669_c0_g1_i1::g.168619::m.168619